MANVVEVMVGTREAEATAVATESGRAVAIESGGAATTDDVMAGNETAATGGVMYANEDPYTIDVRHVEEEMVGTTREAVDGDRVRRGRDGDENGSPRDETDDKTAVTAGDKRDGGDWWSNVYGRRGVRI